MINTKLINEELEITVIADILFNGAESEALECVEEDFTIDDCKAVLIAAKQLVADKKTIDLISLKSLKPNLDISWLSDATDYHFANNHTKQNIADLKIYASRRQAFLSANEIMKACNEGDDAQIDVILEDIKNNKNLSVDNKIQPISGYIDETIEKSFIEFDNPNYLPGLKTGFKEFDYLSGGLRGLITLAARPGMGKTMLVTNMMEFIGTRKNVLMFSLEMPKESIIKRIVKKNEKLDYEEYREIWKDYNLKKISEKDFEEQKERFKIDRMKAASIVEEKNILIDDTPGVDVEYIRKKSIYHSKTAKDGIDLIVIDHIGKITGRQKSVREIVMHITRTLQILQRELNIPIIMLSQLNRNLEVRNDKMPVLSDLKESGSIEEDSNQILFLYRPNEYDENEDPTEARLSLAKNRDGRTGKFKLRCQLDKLEFRRWEERSV